MALVHPPVPSLVVIPPVAHPADHRANVSSPGSSNDLDSGRIELGPHGLDVVGGVNVVGKEHVLLRLSRHSNL